MMDLEREQFRKTYEVSRLGFAILSTALVLACFTSLLDLLSCFHRELVLRIVRTAWYPWIDLPIVWGSLLGTPLGAVFGVLYGILAGDVGLGLDGAVLGCFAFAALGGLYGAALELRSPTGEDPGAAADAGEGVAPAGAGVKSAVTR